MKKAELSMKQNDQKFTSARIKQEVMKQRSKSSGKKNMELISKGFEMLKNSSVAAKNLETASKRLYAMKQTDLPLPMIIPETPFLGHKKCAKAADVMSYCEGGACVEEELTFLTITDNEDDVNVLRCSAENLMNTQDGPVESVGSISDVQKYFHPDIGYEYSALINHENVRFRWALSKPDMHQ